MKKICVSILVLIALIATVALSSCGKGDGNGTYYPSNEEMKTSLESNGYFVELYPDIYIFDSESGDTVAYNADTVRARKDDGNYIQFYRVDKAEGCDYFYNKLRDEYHDAEVFVLIENDGVFGNLVYCGTSAAVDAAGIKVVKVDVNVKV